MERVEVLREIHGSQSFSYTRSFFRETTANHSLFLILTTLFCLWYVQVVEFKCLLTLGVKQTPKNEYLCVPVIRNARTLKLWCYNLLVTVHQHQKDPRVILNTHSLCLYSLSWKYDILTLLLMLCYLILSSVITLNIRSNFFC